MYLISPAIFWNTDVPVSSVRRPGIVLDGRQAEFSPTNSAEEAGGYSPELFPDQPGLHVRPQNVEQERTQANGVGVDMADHGWRRMNGREGRKYAGRWWTGVELVIVNRLDCYSAVGHETA